MTGSTEVIEMAVSGERQLVSFPQLKVKRRIRALTMTEVQLPRLSAQASKLWNAIPIDARRKILGNVFCGHCRGAVSIVNVAGTVKGGDLVLNGNCAVCGHNVARLVEGSNA